MQNNQNPYSNNSPYSVQNPYQSSNSDMSQQIQEQQRLENQRRKQQYKFQCEEALDNITHEFLSAEHNRLDSWKLNAGDKATVVRYYKRYWDSKFVSWAFLALVITFISSFYTQYALIGIFMVFVLREMYAQRIFLIYLLNDHELTRKQITKLKDKIFYKQLKTTTTFVFSAILMMVSYLTYLYSSEVFLEPEKYQKVVELLSGVVPFHVENELFAYTNIGARILLLLLKTYEKWSK